MVLIDDTVRGYPVHIYFEEDVWLAECPALETGACTWGRTREEAERHIGEVIDLILEERANEGT